MAKMFNPPHPGEVLQDGLFAETGFSSEDFAARIGVEHARLLRVLNAQEAVNPDFALRLAAALGGTADSWLLMQTDYDLWQEGQKNRPAIARLKFRNT